MQVWKSKHLRKAMGFFYRAAGLSLQPSDALQWVSKGLKTVPSL